MIIKPVALKLSLSLSLLAGLAPNLLFAQESALRPAEIIGSYRYVGGIKDGTTLEADHFGSQKVVITETEMRLFADTASVVMAYKLGEARNQATSIDLEITKGPFGEGAKTQGLLQQNDDLLKLCYDSTGASRPTSFDAKSGSGHFAFHLKPETLDAAKLRGKWRLIRGRKDGTDVSPDRLHDFSLEVTDKQFVLQADDKFVMDYLLTNDAAPAKVQLTMVESPFGQGSKASGIVALAGDELYFCYGAMGKTPQDFAADEDSGCHLFVMKRRDP